MKHGRTIQASVLWVTCAAWVICPHASAVELDLTKLPPPATATIEFDRDIKPIFEKSCFRCHGTERPKSHFSLVTRESALKGGENNADDVVPGNGARSRLVHYVARLVEDMAMPPENKGEPLTPEQVGLLRAWIDQGAKWGATESVPQTTVSIAPIAGWIGVSGDKKKFRELEGVKEGWQGGIEHFSMQERIGTDKKFSAEGRALFDQHDAELTLALEKTDVGFIRAGYREWRRYYDDTGGYYRPFDVPGFDLGRDLHLDHQRAWIDFGLNLPDNLQIVLGYEYQSKRGSEATLEWGPVGFAEQRNIYPASKDIDEYVHIVKADLTHEVAGWQFEDNVRVEFYHLKNTRDDAVFYTFGPQPDLTTRARESADHVQGANTIRIEKQLKDWWLFSGGYFYSRFDGHSSLDSATLDSTFTPVNGDAWHADGIVLNRDTHVFSLANLFSPMEGLTATAGVQSEWSRQEGFGKVYYYEEGPVFPDPSRQHEAMVEANLDKTKTTENVGLRFAKLSYTVLFAEARLEQESLGQFEQGAADHDLLRDTDAQHHLWDWRAGFHTSPWRWCSLSAHYRQRHSDSDYDHRIDLSVSGTNTTPDNGYSAFIRQRKINTDEVQAKLALRPTPWLKAALTYQIVMSDYFTATDPASATSPFTGFLPDGASPGGRVFAGNYDSHIYGFNVSLVPVARLYLSGTLTYTDTRTATSHEGNPDAPPYLADPVDIADYKGHTWSLVASANYAATKSISLNASYYFSQADFGQDNFANGLPQGIEFTRHGLNFGVTKKWNESVSTSLRYGFFQYSEPTAGGMNDYTAHGVFATVNYTWQ